MTQPQPLPVIPFADLVLPRRQNGGVFSSRHSGALTDVIPGVLGAMMEREHWSFSCGEGIEGSPEETLTTDEVVAADGMLPAILAQASELMRLSLGETPGLEWAEDQNSLCTRVPVASQENSASTGVWALFCHYAMETLVASQPKLANAGEPVSMTKWRQAFLAGIERGGLRPVAAPRSDRQRQ